MLYVSAMRAVSSVPYVLLAALLGACSAPAAPDHPDASSPDAMLADARGPVGCGAPSGTLHAQSLALGDGIEDRVYWLHVPASYDCTAPSPLLVDFHGTAGSDPEEAYQTDALIALSEQRGFIAVRPRSRSSNEGGQSIYRWDQNPGDLARNATFAKHLVADLEQRYAIDPARVYASGFSSGSNMTAQFLRDASSPFHGLAPIAGGLWSTAAALPSLAAGPRVWMSTGYRDYLWPDARSLAARLVAAGLPGDHLVVRHTGGGHDLYAWQFAELWSFLDGGERPVEGSLAPAWRRESLPSPTDVIAVVPEAGGLLAAGAQGHVWQRDAAGVWTLAVTPGSTGDHAALCATVAGTALVGGQYEVALRTGATWSTPRGLPDYGLLGRGWANTAVCRDDGSIVVAGYWSAAVTGNGGQSWSELGVPSQFPGVNAQLAGRAQSPGGATVLVGYYDYIGRAAAGSGTTTAVDHASSAEWWNAVAAVAGGRFWVVGDDGAILASTDDGLTWAAQASGTTANLYGVHFADARHGAAVGLHGTVVVTADGGEHWTARPVGLDRFLGGVVVAATAITVVGEGGLVATSAR